MDPHRFDALARLLVAAPSRRRVVQILFGSAATALGQRGYPETAVARVCQRVDQRCDERHPCCTPGGQCINGRCACRQEFTICDGDCVDRQTDHEHCGACGNACGDREQCCNGTCCNRFETCCGGQCVDLEFSDTNCGGCGQTCPPELRCCGSRCRDVSSDPVNCGSCRGNCETGGGTCSNGSCKCPTATDCGSANRCGGPPGTRCCFDHKCDASLCCSGSCNPGDGLCAPCEGSHCEEDRDCCESLPCRVIPIGNGRTGGRCGGCLDRNEECDPAKPTCCATDCTLEPKEGVHRCVSRRGGPCRRDDDCWTCLFGKKLSKCAGICRDGTCTR